MLALLRSGDWLTRERIKVYSWILIAQALLALAGLVVFADGLVDAFGKPLGTDFSNVWTAGRMVLEGHAPLAYDPASHYAVQQQTFARADIPFYGWHYPPFFLLVAAVLALLPYAPALVLWQAATLPLYLVVVRKIAPHPLTLVAALAFPAVFINLGHGHNGFLTAALIGGALLCLDRRAILAGVLIGLLAYKPQFGIFLPLVLAVSGRWTTFAAASLTVAALVAVATLAFGIDIWTAFLESTGFTREIVLEAGGTGWEKIQSLFSAVRHLGGSVEAAYAAQLVLAAALTVSLTWLWRGSSAFALKAAALIAASLLVTPYALDYDMVALAPAIAWFAAHGVRMGFRDWEKTTLAVLWIAPLISRTIGGHIPLPIGFLAMLAFYGVVMNRAWSEQSVAAAHGDIRHA
ncbi:glycosyltransferase family 87 protein [Breoghania sp. L-A4]|uniref:glycosyltransferase family 87 protein n=1 Tax=Breoghania sp. L-A4 TaxID=2304600 RepID=UPI000E36068B|nr:glycosyltransferase family 87 protein [Breoghania sp. L-A4]AXS42053.1 DUF2029 domain-containing protein [Breoghania sp. L-A4]